MSEAKAIYNKVASIDDLANVAGAEESAYLEFKSVKEDLNSAKDSVKGDFKLRIAKEMCAFANTDAGVIAIGVDEKTVSVDNNTAGLMAWMDNNIRHMLEPQLSGVVMKECGDDSGNAFVLMFIPKGNAMPYRVAAPSKYEQKKDIAREYYQRIGTHSEKIAMPIVRSLYLSNDRVTRFRAEPTLIHMSRPQNSMDKTITFGLAVQPDPTKLIKDYYLESEVMLLDSGFGDLIDEPVDIGWWSINQPIIPPSDDVYIYNEKTISSINPTSAYTPSVPGDDAYVSPDLLAAVYAVYIKTSFACEGVPKITDHRVIVIGKHSDLDINSWHKTSNWIDEKCPVVRYTQFSNDDGNMAEMYAMENYIREKGLINP